LLVIFLGVLLLPTLNLGFVADDFLLLVPDQKLPLTQAADQLHRPLRNATLRIVEDPLGIQHVLPYRLLIALTFVAGLLLLFRLMRRLGANPLGALAAVFLLAFFPRNSGSALLVRSLAGPGGRGRHASGLSLLCRFS
jgi:hypothetical protein